MAKKVEPQSEGAQPTDQNTPEDTPPNVAPPPANPPEGEPSNGAPSDQSPQEPQPEQGEPTAEGDDVAHESAPYGLKADGTPAAKRGPKPKSAGNEGDKQRARLRSVSPGKGAPQKPVPMAAEALAVVNYQAMGEMVAGVWFNAGQMLLGEEWAPDVKGGEHLAVAGAFRDYFKAQQIKDLPPGFALVAVLGIYTLKRANRPTIREKLQGVGAWLKQNLRFRK